jgi:hypothetical protein
MTQRQICRDEAARVKADDAMPDADCIEFQNAGFPDRSGAIALKRIRDLQPVRAPLDAATRHAIDV